MNPFHESIITIINQRLKLGTVKRNLLNNFGVSLDSTDDLRRINNINKIQSLSPIEKNKFIVELGGRVNFKTTESYLKYENII